MNILDKIKEDHKKKSAQIRKLKKTLKYKTKTTITLEKLRYMLSQERRHVIDYKDYDGFYGIADKGYVEDCTKREARIELLEEIIRGIDV